MSDPTGSGSPGVVRRYVPTDAQALSAVCLRTGDAGADATGRFDDDELLPDIYLLPYLAFEPELAHVIEIDGRPAGYIVATADSVAFARRYRRDWLPAFAARHPLVDPPTTATETLVRIGHAPEHLAGPDHALFPAHLHIDLLPEAQGHGWGRVLMRSLISDLREAGVPGVQLGVGERNARAQAFYRHLGFTPLPSAPLNRLRLGIRTDARI